jgi:hypothetical protein
MSKPKRLENLLEKIQKCIKAGRYLLTLHALDRQMERKISLPEVIYVLKTGHEENRKTLYDSVWNTWRYAIRGKTIQDAIDIRIIVAFDDEEMLIITVMQVGKL